MPWNRNLGDLYGTTLIILALFACALYFPSSMAAMAILLVGAIGTRILHQMWE